MREVAHTPDLGMCANKKECVSDERTSCWIVNGECVCTQLHTDKTPNILLVILQVIVIGISALILEVVGWVVFSIPYSILYLSAWFFIITIVVIIYPGNYVTNSYIVTGILPLGLLVAISLDYYIIDILHGVVLVVALVILFLNKPISLLFVWGFTALGIIWFTLVYDLIYLHEPNPFVFGFMCILNGFIVTLVQRYRHRD